MHSGKSLLVTFGCAVLILGMGYFGIVQGGRLLLHNESAPEQAKYENTSSNVFYGKIEDDIELYPWNYYSEEGTYGVPQFGMFYTESYSIMEETLLNVIAQNTEVSPEEISRYYAEKPIIQNLKIGKDEQGLQYYFFQDTPELGGRKYQIKIACDNWSIQSVLCNEIRAEGIQNTKRWESGKEALTGMLEVNREKLEEQMSLLYGVNSGYMGGGIYDDGNRIIMGIFNSMVTKDEEAYEMWTKEKQSYGQVYPEVFVEAEYQNPAQGFSYQVLERSDVILLLLQSDNLNIGLYYDPISVKFCGYNFL